MTPPEREFKAVPVDHYLTKHRGNITAAAQELNAGRNTVAKYARDFNCEKHAVINGKLMVWNPPKNREEE